MGDAWGRQQRLLPLLRTQAAGTYRAGRVFDPPQAAAVTDERICTAEAHIQGCRRGKTPMEVGKGWMWEMGVGGLSPVQPDCHQHKHQCRVQRHCAMVFACSSRWRCCNGGWGSGGGGGRGLLAPHACKAMRCPGLNLVGPNSGQDQWRAVGCRAAGRAWPFALFPLRGPITRSPYGCGVLLAWCSLLCPRQHAALAGWWWRSLCAGRGLRTRPRQAPAPAFVSMAQTHAPPLWHAHVCSNNSGRQFWSLITRPPQHLVWPCRAPSNVVSVCLHVGAFPLLVPYPRPHKPASSLDEGGSRAHLHCWGLNKCVAGWLALSFPCALRYALR
jgi:hypothetical protein